MYGETEGYDDTNLGIIYVITFPYISHFSARLVLWGVRGRREGNIVISITNASILKRDLGRFLPLGLMALSLL